MVKTLKQELWKFCAESQFHSPLYLVAAHCNLLKAIMLDGLTKRVFAIVTSFFVVIVLLLEGRPLRTFP